ncbi:MAG: DNA ligase D [Polyangiaceae bacterium]|nr:DNA ligase D [Polyangiaceae bacterium]
MPRSLHDYRHKRDQTKTNEPLGDESDARGSGPTWRGAFVMHQHDATRMHYDLRLEVGGVLASFAIPHGPTLDPQAKHLAVHTEDHPIEYLDFEAVIPDGTYGAGPMIAWDLGSVRYLDMSAEEGLVEGKLHFVLEGRKLRGRFGLVRLKPKDKSVPLGRDWLFMKKQDAHASGRDLAAEQPRSVLSGLTVKELLGSEGRARAVEDAARAAGARKRPVDVRKVSPMLCTPDDLPSAGRYLYELKMDGVRVLAQKSESGVSLYYRSGRPATASYPEIARAVGGLAARSVVLDGEILAFDDKGKPSFERLATRIHRAPKTDLKHALADVPVVYMVFDLLGIGDLDLRPLPLVARKALLRELLPAPGVLRVLDHLEGKGDVLLAFCRENGLEGVVAKRMDSPYVDGPARTAHWIKTKCTTEAEFVVVGYTEGEGTRRRLGALELASYEGDDLVRRGRVGSGLNEDRVDKLLALLGPLASDVPTAKGEYEPVPAPRKLFHVEPKIVVRVRFLEWSEDGVLRHSVFLGIEPDLDPKSCRAAPHDEDHVVGAVEAELPAAEEPPEPEIVVKVTNRNKVFWPEEKYTKGDLVDYYAAIAPVLLPYLEDRPVMLVRYPDGIDNKNFYQWNVPHGMPTWVRSVVLGKHVSSADESDHKKHVFLIDRPESLIYIANLACIPIHVLASRVGSPNQCDFLTIDFDLHLSTLAAATRLATTLRGLLAEAGLVGFPKTSGQTGLHVFVPLGAGVTPSAARTLADLLGRMIVDRHPDIATMERTVQKRGPRVYVDTGQTGPSRTIVAPYSVRATRGARVSTPITWAELEAGVDPGAFTIRTVLDRIGKLGDPMCPLLSTKPNMDDVMGRLASMLPGRP